MQYIVAAFILGMAIGIWLYRLHVINILESFPYTTCDYCKFRIKREELFPARKKRKQSEK
ncbi:MAG: hypothetical protein LUE24_13760 [Lachnospiraceae bacterium]|nr:hypothetical protein [Lachnospiraceae bacterium]